MHCTVISLLLCGFSSFFIASYHLSHMVFLVGWLPVRLQQFLDLGAISWLRRPLLRFGCSLRPNRPDGLDKFSVVLVGLLRTGAISTSCLLEVSSLDLCSPRDFVEIVFLIFVGSVVGHGWSLISHVAGSMHASGTPASFRDHPGQASHYLSASLSRSLIASVPC